jgi:hypothetical protein
MLFNPSTNHSFIARRIITKIGKGVKIIEKRFVIGTLMGNMVETNNMYVGVGLV